MAATHPASIVVARLGLTLCDPMDCSLPAPLSMGFPRRGLLFPPPGGRQGDSLPLSHQGSPHHIHVLSKAKAHTPPVATWQLRGAEEGRAGEGFSWGPRVDTALARGRAGSSDGSATAASYSGLSEGFLRLKKSQYVDSTAGG